MKRTDRAEQKRNRFLFWTPRILTILFIAFLSMFSLDVFMEGYGFPNVLLALFMHLIPSFILIIVLIISWKHEWVGALVFLLAGTGYIIRIMANPFEWYLLSWSFQIAVPAFLIEALFVWEWLKKRKHASPAPD